MFLPPFLRSAKASTLISQLYLLWAKFHLKLHFNAFAINHALYPLMNCFLEEMDHMLGGK